MRILCMAAVVRTDIMFLLAYLAVREAALYGEADTGPLATREMKISRYYHRRSDYLVP